MMTDDKLAYIFDGLTNQNIGFDSQTISHFSPEEFEMVIDRCAEQAIVICGVEVFCHEDGLATLLEVEINPCEFNSYAWAHLIARSYLAKPGIAISATYSDPENGHKYALIT